MPKASPLPAAPFAFIEARFFEPDETVSALEQRFMKHLRHLRDRGRIGAEDEEAAVTGAAAERDSWAAIDISRKDQGRIAKRANRLVAQRKAASGLGHLKREDAERLEGLREGVRLIRLTSEHQADVLAAELHAEFPWMGPATEVVWHAMRRAAREGLAGVHLPPLLLDGPPGIGKSVWARRLGTLLACPSVAIDATNENASFGIVGSQRGWSTGGPGRVLQTILQTRVGNPIVIVDEIEKAGTAESSKGRSFDLATSLLPLLEGATAKRWTCPFYEVRFDMGWVNWVLTTNNWRLLPEPLLSRCPPIRLPRLASADLTGFARRQGQQRGLSEISVEAIVAALQHEAASVRHLNLRSVIRMLDRAAVLEAGPTAH